MKRMRFRFTAGFLAATLLLSLLSGCAGNGAPSSSASPSGIPENGQSQAQKTHVLKALGPETIITQYFKMGDRENYPVWHEFEKHAKDKGLAFEFELVPDDQYKVVIQTRMAAAADLPDMVSIGALDNTTALNLGQRGILLPLNDIIEQYSDGTAKSFYGDGGDGDFARKVNTATDGNMYWFTSTASATYKDKPVGTTMTVIYRQDWREKLGIPSPTTAEEFFEMLKAFRDKDANGNGAKDEIMVISTKRFQTGIAQWFGLVFGLDTKMIGIDMQTHEVVSPWYQPGVKDYFRYMNRLYNEGILDPSAQEDQTNAANAMSANYNYGTQTWLEPATGVESAYYMPLLPLPAVAGIDPLQVLQPSEYAFSWSKYAFTKNCNDPVAIAKALDLFTSWWYNDLSEWGIEGVHYTMENGEKKSLIEGVSDEQLFNDKSPIGVKLWGLGVFPRMNWGYRLDPYMPTEEQIRSDPRTAWNLEAMNLAISDSTKIATNDSGAFYALPTPEQVERASSLRTDLETYSEELCTKLIIGEASLDDWDTYMTNFKELGLDEMLKIYQDQHDRYRNS